MADEESYHTDESEDDTEADSDAEAEAKYDADFPPASGSSTEKK